MQNSLRKICHYQQNVPQHYYLLDTLVLKLMIKDVLDANFQISTSAHLILVKMAAHALILLEVTAVIVCRDILATTVKQVIVS